MPILNDHAVTKILAGAAIVLVSLVAGAPTAGADPNPAGADPSRAGADPSPFGALSCSCERTAPAGSPALRAELNRGLRAGLSAG
jgi:hypothetical protein